MKNIIIILTFLSAYCVVNLVNAQCREINHVYWEQLSDSIKQETIASNEVDDNAINYYKGIIKFVDDEKSFQLLKILTSKPENRNIKALYFYLFNMICIKADGAAAEGLGNYCQKIIVNDPIYVLNYFSSHNPIMKRYAQSLGAELYFKEKEISDIKYNFNDFNKLINDKIGDDTNLKNIFKDFCREIERIMKSMD